MSCLKEYSYNIPDEENIKIYRGGTWVMEIILKQQGVAVDITGYTPLMEIRDRDTGALVATPTPTVLDATVGRFQFSLTAAETLALPLITDDPAVYLRYDSWLVSVGETLALFTGAVIVTENVTVTV